MTSTDTLTAVPHGEFITGNEIARIILDGTLYMVQIRLDNGCWDCWYTSRSRRNADLVYANVIADGGREAHRSL